MIYSCLWKFLNISVFVLLETDVSVLGLQLHWLPPVVVKVPSTTHLQPIHLNIGRLIAVLIQIPLFCSIIGWQKLGVALKRAPPIKPISSEHSHYPSGIVTAKRRLFLRVRVCVKNMASDEEVRILLNELVLYFGIVHYIYKINCYMFMIMS